MRYKKTHSEFADSCYKFTGIDSWNGKEISGHIIYRPWNGHRKQWAVSFALGGRDIDCAFEASTLKECKQWLED